MDEEVTVELPKIRENNDKAEVTEMANEEDYSWLEIDEFDDAN